MSGCLGCSEVADLLLSQNMSACYEGRDLVVYEQVLGRNAEWEFEVVRIKCDYCIHCGRRLEDGRQETD